jgi:UPF0176 protein
MSPTTSLPNTPPITNIAAYQFAALSGLKEWRSELLAECKSLGLKGTILISTEGINLFVAGARDGLERLLALLRARPGLESLAAKYSESDYQPFTRMLVRIKKEIIAFGVEGIDPAKRTSPKLKPAELKKWLDEGRPVTLLDTRNDYEVKLGTFRNALTFDLDHFRNFPAAVRTLPESLKDQPIVMFCTGGIRCEKAGPFMEKEGYKHIYQLEGGILKYFEDVGSAHYDGECFVFDQRVGVNPELSETGSVVCFHCQTPLTAEEQQSDRYVPGKSCPACWRDPAESMAVAIARRQETLRHATTPLPGSVPYDNYRPMKVPEACHGLTLGESLATMVPQYPADYWTPLFAAGRILDEDKKPVTPDHRVHTGERLFHLHPATLEPDVSNDVRILLEDDALIVVNKPAPLPMHAGGRFNRNTLAWFLALAYHPQKPRVAHRLDANTTGLVVACRTQRFASLLQPQFQRGEVTKQYLVKVTGHPPEDTFKCAAPISRETGPLGSRDAGSEDGMASTTEFTVLRRNADGTTLLEARPLTGRTNQIRLHLQYLGFPVCGDPLYLANRELGTVATLSMEDAPLCLHAWKIGFQHPAGKGWMTFTAEPPAWAAEGG